MFGALVQAQLAAAIAAWIAAYSHLKVALFTDNVNVDSGTDLSTLTEPTASWYTRKTPVAGAVIDTPQRGFTKSFGMQQWNYSGSDAPTDVFGWILLDEGAGPGPVTYLAGGNFDTPVTLQATYDGAIAEPGISFPAVEQAPETD